MGRLANLLISAANYLEKKPADEWLYTSEWIIHLEGGYVNDPQDPGGATNMGITITALSNWRKSTCTAEDIRSLSRAEALDIYRTNYWHANRCDEMPHGVDLVVLDCVVMTSPRWVHRWLQAAVGAQVDGILGDATMKAVRTANPANVISYMTESRIAYYKTLSNWEHDGKGWESRAQQTADRALNMVSH